MSPEDFASSIIFWSSLVSGILILAVLAFVGFIILRVVRGANSATAIRAMKMPVPGTLLVTASSIPDASAVFQSGRITGVVSGEGVAATAVQLDGLFRTSKWPQPGQQLPVTVDRMDPNRFAIEWDRIADSREAALDQAEALAAAMRERGQP